MQAIYIYLLEELKSEKLGFKKIELSFNSQ